MSDPALFLHLRTHSAYSLSEGAIKVPALLDLAKQHKMPALALTDRNNLFGALVFSENALEAGIQPIIGCLLNVEHPGSPGGKARVPTSLSLLVQNEQGYKNLSKLVSHAHLRSSHTDWPEVPGEVLAEHASGLIALTSGKWGSLGRFLLEGNKTEAQQYLAHMQTLFGDRVYVEIARHGEAREQAIEEPMLDLAFSLKIPIVATNAVFYATPDLFDAHDILLCIAQGVALADSDRETSSAAYYFKSQEDMRSLFSDLPEAIANTSVIAQRCAFSVQTRKTVFPKAYRDTEKTEAEILKERAHEGLEERLQTVDFSAFPSEKEGRAHYEARFAYELKIIEQMGFPGYFLVVADFVQWAKNQSIPVGPGRGSGAGSLIAWALTITDLDPIRFSLIFERFLNPERVSLPDFDIDFCQDRRDEVIEYVRQKYGTDHVAQIITFGKLQARAVLRDVGRVLGLPYGYVDKLCKLVPNNPAHPVTLTEAMAGEQTFQEMMDEDPQIERLVSIALKLESLYRHASTHAAGIVISEEPLEDVVPLYKDPRSDIPVTQFDMKYVEKTGLIKFDFLGLKTLTVLQKTVDFLQARGVNLTLADIPLDDAKTFELLHRVETTGVFQLESAGMREVVRNLSPDRFEDLIALVALFRPGPMDDIPRYISCKHGQEEVRFLHPKLEPILASTYGVMVYQEQVMQIAQVLGGYTLGQADILRRAMGKKIHAEMETQRKRFLTGAQENGVEASVADRIFDQMAKFASYGFNKSHAAPYALLAYQTAFLKANYPLEFMATLMTCDLGNIDKLNNYRQELARLDVPLLPPDINLSDPTFSVAEEEGRPAIRYALAGIKGSGLLMMQKVVEERVAHGLFQDIFDFCQRFDARVSNRRIVEVLILGGAFDAMHASRRLLSEHLDDILKQVEAYRPTAATHQQHSLFGEEDLRPVYKREQLEGADWPPLLRLQREFQVIGFYLSAHPLDIYQEALQALRNVPLQEVIALKRERFTLACVVLGLQKRIARSGKRYAFLRFSDMSGGAECVVFSELLEQAKDLFEEGRCLLLTLKAAFSGDSYRLSVDKAEDLEQALASLLSGLHLTIASPEALPEISHYLQDKPPGSLWIRMRAPEWKDDALLLPERYQLSFQDVSFLRSLSGVTEVSVELQKYFQR
ncbi:MAG: DNA polymerase III subunit alpha [Holosporales bacterium]|jgi:DNA polymerase-3 subunit alpha|nr:DNA polymerase III subunit alpha [Holosporales bacterium]